MCCSMSHRSERGGRPDDQSKRGMGGLTNFPGHAKMDGRRAGHVARRAYDEGVQAWLEGGQRAAGDGDVISASRFLCIVARSRLGTCDDLSVRVALCSMLRSVLSTLVILGSEDAHDVGTYFQILRSYSRGKDGDEHDLGP